MPLLMNFTRAVRAATARPSPSLKFLLPGLFWGPGQQQSRSASIVSDLRNVASSYNKRIRRGRGPSSGKGKTSGRGHKGQKQHGKVPAGFEGGQTPIAIVHGPRGWDNKYSETMSPLNLDRLQSWINQGRIDPTKPITLKELVDSRCLHGIKDGVKILARGKEELKTPIDITVSRASKEAIKAIEAAGGKVVTRYFTKDGIKSIIYPHLFKTPRRLANPTARKDIEYYRDPDHRGYLSHTVSEGESPSLFWKIPGPNKVGAGPQNKGAGAAQKKAKEENRLF
ncbi:ribosomal protein L18e/L15P [Morchella snyderi]|nr:ribosomal protein L18e/L15P [Morchella snyderi]